ncbi:MAG: aminoglycoside phosphotransferase family protein, partial [Catenulispora sp.]|nr:aminoglycoside phosphotransferase family protein [Catenulispora sp.]
DALMPGVRLDAARLAVGQFHEVVLIPGVAAVRISRRARSAEALPRRTQVLCRLAAVGLPFAVPEPLTEVTRFGERAAVVHSWVNGRSHAKGEGSPEQIAALLGALREVSVTELADVLGEPHEYAGGHRWAEVMAEEVVPRLPAEFRDEARRRLDDALALEPVPPSLVHGDLAGDNVHWDEDGKLVGVLDWDLAQPFDPAIDAACLAWHGWENVRAAVDARTYRRAGVWFGTFGIEQIGAAVLNGEPQDILDRFVAGTVAWMQSTADWKLP